MAGSSTTRGARSLTGWDRVVVASSPGFVLAFSLGLGLSLFHPLPYLAATAAAAVTTTVYLLARHVTAPTTLVRCAVVSALLIVPWTLVAILVLFVVAWAHCPPDAYECPI